MFIYVSNINALMRNTISNNHSRETQIYQQTDMAMSDSLDPYSFHSFPNTPTTYFVMQVEFCEWEYIVIFSELQ